MSIKLKINIILSIAIVVLSIYVVIWNHEMYILYKQYQKVQTNNHKLIATQKQLLTEYSQKVSGEEIKNKAVEILNMRLPKTNNIILLQK